MNSEITRFLSAVSCPSKQIVLSVLGNETECTISEIRDSVLLETEGLVTYPHQTYRYSIMHSLLPQQIVLQRDFSKNRKRPSYFSLEKPVFGDLAKRVLSFVDETNKPLSYFIGHGNNHRNKHSFASAHTLYLADKGELNGMYFDDFPNTPFLTLWSVYELFDKGLLSVKDRTYTLREDASYFVSEIYTPIIRCIKHNSNPFKRKNSQNLSLGELFLKTSLIK